MDTSPSDVAGEPKPDDTLTTPAVELPELSQLEVQLFRDKLQYVENSESALSLLALRDTLPLPSVLISLINQFYRPCDPLLDACLRAAAMVSRELIDPVLGIPAASDSQHMRCLLAHFGIVSPCTVISTMAARINLLGLPSFLALIDRCDVTFRLVAMETFQMDPVVALWNRLKPSQRLPKGGKGSQTMIYRTSGVTVHLHHMSCFNARERFAGDCVIDMWNANIVGLPEWQDLSGLTRKERVNERQRKNKIVEPTAEKSEVEQQQEQQPLGRRRCAKRRHVYMG